MLVCSVIVCHGQQGTRATADQTTIKVRGSSNVSPLVEKWAPAFADTSQALPIDVLATGSSEGIGELLHGRADIAMSSRPMSPEESAIAHQRGLEIRETVVARMGIGVVVNAANPVSSLTFGELADVFSGAASGWQELGGSDEPILVVRKESGWSPGLFRRKILGEREFGADAVIVDSKEAVVAEVGVRPWSIGFTGLAEAIPDLDRVHLLRLVNDISDEDATYALSRPLFFYTLADSPTVQPFLEFVVGSEAQGLIIGTGIYPAQEVGAATQ